MTSASSTHAKRSKLKYISLFCSFAAATAAVLAAHYGNYWAAMASALLWLASVAVDYYSTTVHGLAETQRERLQELEEMKMKNGKIK